MRIDPFAAVQAVIGEGVAAQDSGRSGIQQSFAEALARAARKTDPAPSVADSFLRFQTPTALEMQGLGIESLRREIPVLNTSHSGGIGIHVERRNVAGETQDPASAKDICQVRLYPPYPKEGWLDIRCSGDLRITTTDDGQYAVYFAESDTTRVYNPETGDYQEFPGDIMPEDRDSTYLCATPDSTVRGGAGNNRFLVFADGVTIEGGPGDDTVLLADNARGIRVDTGGGNDQVRGERAYNPVITLGDGDNAVSFHALLGGSINAGSGNTSLDIPRTAGGVTISLGDGNTLL